MKRRERVVTGKEGEERREGRRCRVKAWEKKGKQGEGSEKEKRREERKGR